jgi:hypothetical protein
LLLAGCGGGGSADGDPADAGPRADAGPDDWPLDRVGVVNLIEGGGIGFESVHAMIRDRHELPLLEYVASGGDCTVYRRPDPASCDPACEGGVCTAPNTCTTYPALASAGVITVTGLHVPLAFQPTQYGYDTDPAAPPEDLFADDAHITVTAAGGATPGFSAELDGVPLLEAPFQNLTLVDGQDATITWTGRGAGKVQIALRVGWHGAPIEALMLCETADDGSHTIPGAMVAALPRQSTSLEQHFSWMLRFRRAVVQAPAGPIEIVVGSAQPIYFSHP